MHLYLTSPTPSPAQSPLFSHHHSSSPVVAVDFDSTLCFSKWPDCGEPNQALINSLKKWKFDGNKLILWTCRIGEALSNAVAWCQEYGLEFDAVNDNLPEIVEYYGSNSRKVTCDWYIDDRMLLPETIKA